MEDMEKICLDTDFLVSFLRGCHEENEFLVQDDSRVLATTSVNIFELYYGANKSNEKERNLSALAVLLNNIEVLNFDTETAKLAGAAYAKLEKQGELIEFRDLFIGIIAKENGYKIKTKNKRHFSKIEDLELA
jgi:predicted nucleic acid-binding protein